MNVHEELLVFTLAIDEDEFAEIEREMRRREDVEPPYVRFDPDKTRTLSFEWLAIPYVSCKVETSTAIGMIKEKKKDWCANEKKVKR